MSVLDYAKRFLKDFAERTNRTAHALTVTNSLLGVQDLPPVFFLHFPKCGGTSISEAFQDHLKNFAYHDLTRCKMLREGTSGTAAQRFGMSVRAYRAALLHYFLTSREGGVKYVSGHFVIDPTIVEEYADEWTYVTLLREPVSRFLSFYFYNRYEDFDRPKAQVTASIEEFIETNRAQAWGQDYVDWLTGRSIYKEGKPFSTPSQYRVEAVKNVADQFDVVGTLEDLSTFETEIHRKLGWPIQVGHENKNPISKKKREEQVKDRLLKNIRELCAPNIKLYEYVQHSVQAENRPST